VRLTPKRQTSIDLRQLEAQPVLIEWIESYRVKLKLASLADAVERLIRIGLFSEAAPDGSMLVRDGGWTGWTPPAETKPEPDDEDILF
jgi:hypothetical protein